MLASFSGNNWTVNPLFVSFLLSASELEFSTFFSGTSDFSIFCLIIRGLKSGSVTSVSCLLTFNTGSCISLIKLIDGVESVGTEEVVEVEITYPASENPRPISTSGLPNKFDLLS
ncbi:GSCOCG00009935001-RA-CDS [Cotesia congregata]|nr:GSCOCG00009935001-RA-CDS [Cotesia congregata]